MNKKRSLKEERRHLKAQRRAAAMWSGLIFGLIVGIAFATVATFRSPINGAIAGITFGGAFGIFVGILSYYEGFYWIPKKIYIPCRVIKGTFKYEKNVTINCRDGEIEIPDVHESAVIADGQLWYIRAGQGTDRRLYVRAGEHIIFVNPLETVII